MAATAGFAMLPYIQDNKVEGAIPSLREQLYLEWNQMVARETEENWVDRGVMRAF